MEMLMCSYRDDREQKNGPERTILLLWYLPAVHIASHSIFLQHDQKHHAIAKLQQKCPKKRRICHSATYLDEHCAYEALSTSDARSMLSWHAKLTPANWNVTWMGVPIECLIWGHYSVEFWCVPDFQNRVHLCIADMGCIKEVDIKLMQRINLYFCYKLGWTHVQARAALEQVYGEDILCISSTRRWYKSFRTGRTTVVDLQRAPKEKTGRTAANVAAVKALIDTDKSIPLASLMHQTGLHQTTVHWIIKKDLYLKLHCAKLLPNFLTPHHIVEHFQHCRDMLQEVRRCPSYLKCLVMMDEAWCYQHDPLLKRQASQWLTSQDPRPVQPCRTLSIKKVLIITFFDFKGMIHHEFI